MTHSIIFRDLLGSLPADSRLLLAVATPLEADAVLAPFGKTRPTPTHPWALFPVADRIDLVITGVGKSPAAAAVASTLAQGRHAGVLNLGIAGSLPTTSPLGLGSSILASAHAFADEGVALPPTPSTPPHTDPFLSLHAMGFAPPGTTNGSVPCDPAWTAILRRHLTTTAFAPIATVSTCSGTDALAVAMAARTGAAAEGMEGAAVALAAQTLGHHYAELRTISNTTGDRPRQVWDLRGALAQLAALLAPPR